MLCILYLSATYIYHNLHLPYNISSLKWDSQLLLSSFCQQTIEVMFFLGIKHPKKCLITLKLMGIIIRKQMPVSSCYTELVIMSVHIQIYDMRGKWGIHSFSDNTLYSDLLLISYLKVFIFTQHNTSLQNQTNSA